VIKHIALDWSVPALQNCENMDALNLACLFDPASVKISLATKSLSTQRYTKVLCETSCSLSLCGKNCLKPKCNWS
jgi:hypothetical protein